jgi:hypothetical protein
MKKLVVVEFTVDEKSQDLDLGDRYSYFQDPKTGKYYRPAAGFVVKSDKDLSDRFIEVPAET